MKNIDKMPDVILDLTDENKTLAEAIAECEAKRLDLLNNPWYKRIYNKATGMFKRAA